MGRRLIANKVLPRLRELDRGEGMGRSGGCTDDGRRERANRLSLDHGSADWVTVADGDAVASVRVVTEDRLGRGGDGRCERDGSGEDGIGGLSHELMEGVGTDGVLDGDRRFLELVRLARGTEMSPCRHEGCAIVVGRADVRSMRRLAHAATASRQTFLPCHRLANIPANLEAPADPLLQARFA